MLRHLWVLFLSLLAGCATAISPTPIPSPSLPSASPTVTEPMATRVVPTAVPTPSPTIVPTTEPTLAPPTPTVIAQPNLIAPTYPAEILFLRERTLVAFDPISGRERTLASEVLDWAVDVSGRQIAVATDQGISIVDRASGAVRGLIDGRIAYSLSWTPDGLALAYAAASQEPILPFDWERWSRWCTVATVYIFDVPTATEREIGPGCDPGFASDGRRLAFATPPTTQPSFLTFVGERNAIRLINRAGANEWNFATADGSPETGLVVYAPVWSPNAREVAYQRFLGYQALVDINLTMIADSSAGGGVPTLAGAGWHRPPAFSPDGKQLALVEYNFSDARGFTGYDVWKLYLIELLGERSEALPDGNLRLRGQLTIRLPRVTAATWAPDGSALAVMVPSAWNPNADPNAPLYTDMGMGEIWQVSPLGEPQRRLVTGVDYASRLVWAPAGLVTAQIVAGAIMFPTDWELLPTTQATDLAATYRGRFLGRRSVTDPTLLSADRWAQTVVDWVAVTESEAPYRLPDGSQLVTFIGQRADGTSVAGVARLSGDAIVISVAPQAEWPVYRAQGIALAMAAR